MGVSSVKARLVAEPHFWVGKAKWCVFTLGGGMGPSKGWDLDEWPRPAVGGVEAREAVWMACRELRLSRMGVALRSQLGARGGAALPLDNTCTGQSGAAAVGKERSWCLDRQLWRRQCVGQLVSGTKEKVGEALKLGGELVGWRQERRSWAGMQECPREIQGRACSHVCAGQVRHSEVVWQELDGFGDTGTIGGQVTDLVASVMLHGGADVPTFFTVWIPRRPVSRRLEHDSNFTPRRRQWGAVEVELANI